MDTQVILTCILSSSVAVAVITTLKELLLWKLNRKAKVEDSANDISERVNKVEDGKKKLRGEFTDLKQQFEDSKSEVLEEVSIIRSDEKSVEDSIKSIKSDMKEQRQSIDNLSNTLSEFQKHILAQYEVSKSADRYILGEHIYVLAMEKIAAGKITYADRKKLHNMWDLYHYRLGANGDLDLVMSQIDKLPLDIDEE